MFFLSYTMAELRRRRTRTILTALGLAVGVALVIVVNALSSGLDRAQARVLSPLTGVGTDMSVTRPIKISSNGQGPFGNLSPSQQRRLRKEAGPPPGLDFRKLKPGSKVDTDTFQATSQLSFPASRIASARAIDGVADVAGSLTLTDMHVYGKVPKIKRGPVTQSSTPPSGSQSGPQTQGAFGASSIHFDSRTVTGIDQTKPGLAPVTPSQVVKGRYFSSAGDAYEAIVSAGYASSERIAVGDDIVLGGKTFHVIGIASSPLGGTASNVYVKLATLQRIAGYEGRVNALQVRAASTSTVASVAAALKQALPGAQVTTAADLAKRVGGSLSDARSLSSKLGTALEAVGLAAAVLIACLLTLSSVAKRVREIGTLKALGWSRWRVVRQISAEALMQGALGGAIGAAAGLAGIAAVNAVGWTLRATVSGGSGGSTSAGTAIAGPFGLGQPHVTSGSTLVKITTSADAQLILAAVGLAVLGGLVAGTAGGLRAARLRPAAALRTVE